MTSLALRRLEARKERTAQRLIAYAQAENIPVEQLRSVRLPWYEIRDQDGGENGEPASILIYEEIGGSYGVNAEQFATDLAEITAPAINVRINSPGGSVFDGIAIYNSLNHHAARIVVHVDSLAASIASIIAMAGDEVVMMPGSQMMIHDASAVVDGQEADLLKMGTLMGRQSDNLADIYRLRAGGDLPQWRELMRAETWMFAHEAVDLGLADRVAVPPKKQQPADDDGERALMTRSFDLSGFRYAGRSAAPVPARIEVPKGATRATPPVPPRAQPSQCVPPRDALYRAVFPGVEVRAATDGGPEHLFGHFAVFNQWTEIDSVFEGHFLERIAPGAFKKTFAEGRASIRALFQHGKDPQVGDKPLGPIAELCEDEIGAYYDVELLNAQYVHDIAAGLHAKLYGASFRFRVLRDQYVRNPKPSAYNPEGIPERTIQEASVSEFGPVTFPAYAGATAGIRSLSDDFLIDALTRSPERLRELMRHLPATAPLDDAGSTTSSGRREEAELRLRPLAPIRRNPDRDTNRKAS